MFHLLFIPALVNLSFVLIIFELLVYLYIVYVWMKFPK